MWGERMTFNEARSFNGKPQASLADFAYACGSPLNETLYACI
jgi:hypothetical protein